MGRRRHWKKIEVPSRAYLAMPPSLFGMRCTPAHTLHTLPAYLQICRYIRMQGQLSRDAMFRLMERWGGLTKGRINEAERQGRAGLKRGTAAWGSRGTYIPTYIRTLSDSTAARNHQVATREARRQSKQIAVDCLRRVALQSMPPSAGPA